MPRPISVRISSYAVNSGDLIGSRYRLDRKIGQGGTGRIWLAQDTRLDRSVAIKFLWTSDASRRARLARRVAFEAKIAASVQHRNVIQIFDFGTHNDETPYIVMEALSGYTLGEAFDAAQSFSLDTLIHVLSEVLRGLSAVHDAGIVHRDLKPDNIFLVKESRGKLSPKLLDFGISRSLDDTRHSAVTTTEGLIVGTPQYMSPEQARGATDIDKRTDIYSLGTVMFEAFAGVVPFSTKNLSELLISVIQRDARPLHQLVPQLGEPLCAVVDKALQKNRDERYAHAAEMLDALLAAAQHVPAQLDRNAPLFPPDLIRQRATSKNPQRAEDDDAPYALSDSDIPVGLPSEEPVQTWRSPSARRRRTPERVEEAPTLRSDEPPLLAAASEAATLAARPKPKPKSTPASVRYGLAFAAVGVVGVAISATVLLQDRNNASAGTGMIVVQAPPSASAASSTISASGTQALVKDIELPEPIKPAEPKPSSAASSRKPSATQPKKPAEDPMHAIAANVADSFSKQKARVIECLNQHPDDIAGTPQLTVRVSLDAAGKVTGSDVLPDAVANKPVVTCVRSVVAGMRFPSPGQPTTFRVPLLWRRK